MATHKKNNDTCQIVSVLLRATRTERNMSYEPATGTELPSYFYAMLDDVDRSLQYWRAIHACIRDLREVMKDKKRPVVVVDVGVGTGMLSAFALLAGADVVIGVDVNSGAISAAEAAIRAIGEAEQKDMASRFVSVLVTVKDKTAQKIRSKINAKLENDAKFKHVRERSLPFDVVISEILGTLVFGESMDTYIAPYIEMTQEHCNTLFAVPSSCRQYFGVYEFRSVPDCLRFAIEHALDNRPGAYCPTDSRGLGVPLYLHDSTCICEPRMFYEMTYKQKVHGEAKRKVHPKAWFAVDSSCAFLRLGVCEWVCVLWEEVVLSNTLRQCVRMAADFGHRYALARQEAWGFMVCNVSSPRRLRIEASYTKSHGMELTFYQGEHVTSLRQVTGYDECSFVSYAADAAIARDIAELCASFARDAPSQPVKIMIMNDTTCGALCTELAEVEHLQVRVTFTPGWQKTHAVTQKVAKRLVSRASTIDCEHLDPRKSLRNLRESTMREIADCNCVVIPELFYMAKNYTQRVEFYKDLLGKSIHTIPDLAASNSKGFNYRCQMRIAPENCGSVMSTLREVGGLTQILKHPEVHFSTREFPSLPFLLSRVENDDSCELINFHEVRGECPSANLHNLKCLLERDDISSLSARMTSGSGLIVRVGPEHTTNCHNISLDENSDVDDDDDDDDDDEI